MAGWALGLGIAGLAFSVIGGGIVLGLLGLVLGIVVLRRVTKGRAAGKGMAIGGLVTGAGALFVSTLLVGLVASDLATSMTGTAVLDNGVLAIAFTDATQSYGEVETMHQAARWWTARGESVQIVGLDDGPDVIVQFVREWGGATLGQHFSGGLLQIGLGDSSCNGQWTPFSEATILFIATHELGHALGHEHVNNPLDIMNPSLPTVPRGSCQVYADTLYVEPGMYSRQTFEVGYGAANLTVHYEPSVGQDYQRYEICLIAPTGEEECHNGSSNTVIFGTLTLGPAPPGAYVLEFNCYEAPRFKCIYEIEVALQPPIYVLGPTPVL